MPSKAFQGVFVPNGPRFCGYRTPDCGEMVGRESKIIPYLELYDGASESERYVTG